MARGQVVHCRHPRGAACLFNLGVPHGTLVLVTFRGQYKSLRRNTPFAARDSSFLPRSLSLSLLLSVFPSVSAVHSLMLPRQGRRQWGLYEPIAKGQG